MATNPLLAELRAVRERLLADAGGTLDGLVDQLQAEEQRSDRPRYRARPAVESNDAENANERPVEKSALPTDD